MYWPGARTAYLTEHRLWNGRSVFHSRQKKEISLFSKLCRPALASTQPLNKWVPSSFSGVKPPDSEADHPSPFSVGVKNEWIYISAPHIGLQCVDRDTFTYLPIYLSTYLSVCLSVYLSIYLSIYIYIYIYIKQMQLKYIS